MSAGRRRAGTTRMPAGRAWGLKSVFNTAPAKAKVKMAKKIAMKTARMSAGRRRAGTSKLGGRKGGTQRLGAGILRSVYGSKKRRGGTYRMHG